MKNSAPQFDAERYEELPDGSFTPHERNMDKLNARFSWLPQAERTRILEEAWFQGPEVYDQIDPEYSDDEVTRIWRPRIEERSRRTLQNLKTEGIRAKTSQLAQKCINGVPAVVDSIREAAQIHMRAFLIAGGLVTGAVTAYAAASLTSHSGSIPVAHAAEQAPE